MTPQMTRDIDRELRGFDWGKLRRLGYGNKLIDVLGAQYAFRAVKPMPLAPFVFDAQPMEAVPITYAAEFSFVLRLDFHSQMFVLQGFIQPNRYARDYYPGTKAMPVERIEFSYERYIELYEQSWATKYADHNYEHPFEHFAQLVIDKTFGVTRYEQSTATFGPERATNGVIRWSGSMENSPEGGHCHQLSVAGHQPRIGR